MNEIRLGVVESRFAELIWENEPIASGALVKLCEKELCWKKPTTYTVLRKLCEKGIFRNEGGVVTAVLSREDFRALQSEQFVSETCGGSLPAFIAAFTSRRKLTPAEADEIQRMIDAARRGG
ncbi:MAG: BlaI/MecI/CopY family transcriptional regulator [Oscillospiraceae bacterium]|nr:BlaI/MecI/CopY family transcriptional regulator [Oscillospiraceae bacterium]